MCDCHIHTDLCLQEPLGSTRRGHLHPAGRHGQGTPKCPLVVDSEASEVSGSQGWQAGMRARRPGFSPPALCNVEFLPAGHSATEVHPSLSTRLILQPH